MAKHSPNPSVAEIEAAIETMKAEGGQTERWMSHFSRRHMNLLAKKDATLRDAYQAGYRTASDRNFILWLIYGVGAFSAGALFEFIAVSYPG